MFVVIEGIDGSGKSTQIDFLKNKLLSIGKSVKIIKSPNYGSSGSYFVEKYLNGDYGSFLDPKLASMFYAIDRFDSNFSLKDDLKKYDFVLSDRYMTASMIHQASKIDDFSKRLDFLEWLKDLEYNVFGIPKPDRVIYLKMSPENSEKLMDKREYKDYIKSDNNKDLHENDSEHIKNASLIGDQIAKQEGRIIVNCEDENGTRNKEDIAKEIFFNISKNK